MRYLAALTLSALTCLPSALATPLYKRQYSPVTVDDFSQLTPSSDFAWTPCFDEFTCTLLTVPLDYEDKAAGTVNIAFIKWTTTSTNLSTPPQDILLNPGGPGGSGTSFLKEFLPYLKLAVGTQNNYIGFDPRGVNNSGPDLSCFPGRHNTRDLYDVELALATDAEDEKALAETWARAGAFGEWCSRVHSSPNSTSNAKYANTIATATDMLHYTELLAKSRGEDPDKSQLWYYGISYGTALGATFASLFPNRIGRMMLDGVLDSEDYYAGRWESNLMDADAAVESFFTYCFEAGATNCTFWADSSDAIKNRFFTIVDTIKERPMTVVDPAFVQLPGIFRFKDLQRIMLGAIYAPSVYFPFLGQLLPTLEAGDASILASTAGVGRRQDTCIPTNPLFPPAGDFEPLPFIACNDANGRFDLTDYDAWLDLVNTLVGESHYVGEVWASVVSVNCRSLNIRAPPSQVFTGTPSASNTSNPILFISNTIDPVTPLRSAEKMRGKFGGAGLLVQEAVGHASVAAFSRCTTGYMTKYLEDATLPPDGLRCDVDQVPFQNFDIEGGAGVSVSFLRRGI